MLYWIGYDLDKPGQDYKDLLDRLRQLGAKRILKSDWLLESELVSQAIWSDLRRFMDSNDRLMVSEVCHNAYWNNLLTDGETVKAVYARSAHRY
jgi:hypothetical protein